MMEDGFPARMNIAGRNETAGMSRPVRYCMLRRDYWRVAAAVAPAAAVCVTS